MCETDDLYVESLDTNMVWWNNVIINKAKKSLKIPKE